MEWGECVVAWTRRKWLVAGSVRANGTEKPKSFRLGSVTDIDRFYADFTTGFAQTGWWDQHRWLTRHHLAQPDGVRHDVNLIDVLEYIADCVMAGMARSGHVSSLQLPPALLERAFQNTVALLQAHIVPAPEEGSEPAGNAAQEGRDTP